MPVCLNCHSEINETDKFCPECGNRVQDFNVPQQSIDASQTTPTSESKPPDMSVSLASNLQSDSKIKTFLTRIALLSVIALIFICIKFLIVKVTQRTNPLMANLAVGEIRNPKDGSILIEIPAGSFIMGRDSGESDAKPAHTVYLNKYYIGKYEVTVGQFRKFVKSTGYRTNAEMYPKNDKYVLGYLLPELRGTWKKPLFSEYSNRPYNQSDNCPVVCVTYWDAKAYCDWAGLRLPTEAEWEKAARGTDERSYPWGNECYINNCNHGNLEYSGFDDSDGYLYTSPVGSFPSGVSPYGAHDMAGNVGELCSDWYERDYYSQSPLNNPTGPPQYDPNIGYTIYNPRPQYNGQVFRGGSYRYDIFTCRTYNRSFTPAYEWYGDDRIGFRVAK